MSPEGILKLLKLPLDLILAVFRYFLGTTKFRKYEKRLIMCLRLTFYRTSMLLPIPDFKLISGISNAQLFKVFKWKYKSFVNSSLPGFGERYGTSGIWLTKHPNRSKHDPIIIYLHGGGYFVQTQMVQLQSLAGFYKLVDPNKKLSVLFLDYDLVCHGKQFPRQLRQLDSIYSKLVEQGNDNILLMGDSAGGHLAISYTQFHALKRSYLPFPTKLLLISPWVNLATNKDDYKPGLSYYDNQPRDIINYKAFEHGDTMLFIEDKNRVNHQYFDWCYNQDGKWDSNPFFNQANNSHEIFLIFGEDESFRDHIEQWVNQIYHRDPIKCFGKSNNKMLPEYEVKLNQDSNKPKLDMFIEPWGIHDSFFFMEFEALDKLIKSQPLNDHDHFGILRLVKYLNDSL